MAQQPVRLGVIGLGRAFTLMLPTLSLDARFELVAACDPREAARAQFKRDFRGRTYGTVEELVADPAVQAVYVASPHQFHAVHTRLTAAARKHVLVEKPMALTLAECDTMIADCAAAGVNLIVGHCHSFDTPYLQARRLIERGTLGRVRMIQTLNYTDFLYRPRRPEELRTEDGGGVVFSQAAHQVDVVRLLAGSRALRVRAVLGAWDPTRPTEGAYAALLWFDDGVFATLAYGGYGHLDSDEWCGWIGEMGNARSPDDYGQARRRLRSVVSADEEALLKNEATYGRPAYKPAAAKPNAHQHFAPLIVACEKADVRPLPDALIVYGDDRRERLPLDPPAVPRFEVIDELHAAVVDRRAPRHDGAWARATVEICVAMLRSARENRDVALQHQIGVNR